MQVINLLGGANTGKTTTALGLSYFMKKAGYRVKYVQEYAEDLVLEERKNVLEEDQLYILAKQNRRLHRMRNLVDYVITDSPLLLTLVYYNPAPPQEFTDLVMSHWNSYDNVVFQLPRDRSFQYQVQGRVQASHEEASHFDTIIEKWLPEDSYRLTPGVDYITQILRYLKLNVVPMPVPLINVPDPFPVTEAVFAEYCRPSSESPHRTVDTLQPYDAAPYPFDEE